MRPRFVFVGSDSEEQERRVWKLAIHVPTGTMSRMRQM